MKQYDKEWKRIDSLLEKEGLTKTAAAAVSAIYSAAKKDNNDAQVIKALLYQLQINDQVSDEGRYENIKLVESEIASAKEPAKSILSSIAGSSYWQYLQMNRWQFYDRTRVKNYQSNDIATWDISQLHAIITKHFDNSLKETQLLQKTDLRLFDPVIIKGNARSLRPTLYDLLAHRALDYYRNDEQYITKPAYAFEINDTMAFADANAFVKYAFTTSDTLSLHHRALKLYQELLRFHLNDKDKNALVDADISRLNFVNNFSTVLQKEEKYKSALENLVKLHPNVSAIADAMYQIANWYMMQGSKYVASGDTSNRYAIVEAKAWCEKAIAVKDSSEGKSNAINLLKEILKEQLLVKSEKVNLPGEPFRILIHYKNAPVAYFRILRTDNKLKNAIQRGQWHDSLWTKLIRTKALQQFEYQLPATNDHQLHAVEAKINALPMGEYTLLVSSDKNFPLKKGSLAVNYFYISDLAYLRNKNRMYLLNRRTGKPLPGATLTVWKEQYNYRTQNNDLINAGKYKADKNGYLTFKTLENKNQVAVMRFDIVYGKDRLFTDDQVGISQPFIYEHDDKPNAYLFTDRSIYRPGQTIFFKGIVVQSDFKNKKHQILVNRKSVVELIDANGQKVDSVTLTTNEFGSYHGKFTLPSNLLNGNFIIREKGTMSDVYINVEEYKRPKFQVEIAQPRGTYRLGDTITVEGHALAFAGDNINGATVRYRVVRRSMVPMWMHNYGFSKSIWPPHRREETEIVNGTIITDANGKFIFRFNALPDKSIPQQQKPLFNYYITADVTDGSGETRSGNTSVQVGYDALKLNVSIAALINKDTAKRVMISSTNMNDSFEASNVKLSVAKLQAPSRLFRERYWEQPDQFIMTREEYYQLFPHDMYSDEADKRKWKKDEPLFVADVMTSGATAVEVPFATLQPGWYLFEAMANDKYGSQVTTQQYVQVIKDSLTGPFATLVIDGSAPADNQTKASHKVLTNISSPHFISELNDTTMKVAFIKNNRVYSEFLILKNAEWLKMLKIDFTSFRNKLLPGNKESWSIKISGIHGEKVAAELLTAMYDASLDQFVPHSFRQPNVWWNMPEDFTKWSGDNHFSAVESIQKYIEHPYVEGYVKNYDRLMAPEPGGRERLARGVQTMSAAPQAQESKISGANPDSPLHEDAANAMGYFQEKAIEQGADGAQANREQKIQPRTNLNETAFFFPELRTDSSGNIEFSFTAPEALTSWKWMLLAHTKDLAFAYSEKQIITQKQLMVQPNLPRFLREGDKINISTRIANLSGNSLDGTATLELIDAVTGKPVNQLFSVSAAGKNFSVPAGSSVPVSFALQIPPGYTSAVTYRILAVANQQSGKLTDGEESLLPVIPNRMLVTETLPLPVKGTATKKFRLDKLVNSKKSSTLTNHLLAVEFTSNPAWYAVQSLPYLAEGEKENAEQSFNRLYANAVASSLIEKAPRIKQVIAQWNREDTSAFLSNLQKNEELKSALLQETPWVLEASTESQQKKNIALLFDMVHLSSNLNSAVAKLKQMQAPTGGFVWYPGGPEDRYITQYIVTGIGKLYKMNAIPSSINKTIQEIVGGALAYTDQQLKSDYENLKRPLPKVSTGPISNIHAQYLYMRSFFQKNKIAAEYSEAYQYYFNQATIDWVKQNTYTKGMIALTLFRANDKTNAKRIIASLKETAINKEELGMYWKDMAGGYYWYQAPIETQALMIEAFTEIADDDVSADNMKTWLLKNKQTNSWKTSRATADASYALLLKGSDWLADQPDVTISLGDKKLSPEKLQPGTGYFKYNFPKDSITASMGNITVQVNQNKNNKPAWGAVYWQYFENLDKITTASTPLSIKKQLFIQKNSDRGPELQSLAAGNELKVGDRITVRVEIVVDRDLEYVHLKDMRASTFEPVNVLSGFKWRSGIGYYESTKDISTNYYFGLLKKGVHVFEYDMFAAQSGEFSNGNTTIQCMYAPEFSSHSEGIKVKVVE